MSYRPVLEAGVLQRALLTGLCCLGARCAAVLGGRFAPSCRELQAAMSASAIMLLRPGAHLERSALECASLLCLVWVHSSELSDARMGVLRYAAVVHCAPLAWPNAHWGKDNQETLCCSEKSSRACVIQAVAASWAFWCGLWTAGSSGYSRKRNGSVPFVRATWY